MCDMFYGSAKMRIPNDGCNNDHIIAPIILDFPHPDIVFLITIIHVPRTCYSFNGSAKMRSPNDGRNNAASITQSDQSCWISHILT